MSNPFGFYLLVIFRLLRLRNIFSKHQSLIIDLYQITKFKKISAEIQLSLKQAKLFIIFIYVQKSINYLTKENVTEI